MAKNILISLLSEHLLPNYLFIKEMEGKYDELLFITTSRMKESATGRRLEKALGIPTDNVKRIEVSEDSLESLLSTLEAEGFGKENDYIVNLTGGTKIMSLGVYDFFSNYTSSFYYIPIGKNTIKNVRTSEDLVLRYRANVYEYLTLYGLSYSYDQNLHKSSEATYDLFQRFKAVNFNRKRLPEIYNAHSFDRSDSKYYSGLWFEEYTYLRIKEEKALKKDFICKGACLYREESGNTADNEIDVMYMDENRLYIIECKVSMIGMPGLGGTKLLEQYMYKLAAISKDFGLVVNSYIFTLHNFHRITPASRMAMEKRMRILGIRGILDGEDFRQNKLNF